VVGNDYSRLFDPMIVLPGMMESIGRLEKLKPGCVMETKFTKIMFAGMLLLGLSLLTGCLAMGIAGGAAAGAGAVVYVKGEHQTNVDAPMAKCITAANQAISNLQLRKIDEANDGISAKIKARNAKDQAITIQLKVLTENATHIAVRVGTWGDKAASQQIIDEIKKELPTGRS
jgi:hypothetical protein